MLSQAKSENKMFRKILRALPSLSGLWPGEPIVTQHLPVFGVKEALQLDSDTNVGVGSRCPGKVAEIPLDSQQMQSKNIYLLNWTETESLCSSSGTFYPLNSSKREVSERLSFTFI